jgi:cell filamentation protein
VNNRDKYTTSDKYSDENNDILKNKLGITSSEEIEEEETRRLVKAYEILSETFSDDHTYSALDIQYIHKVFLGDIYEWAGKYRDVDIASEDIRWCHAQYIPNQMNELDKLLKDLTPFSENMTYEELIRGLSEIHGELIIIHPFRDGNGRTTRLFCDLLLMQSGRLPIDRMNLETDSGKKEYFKAIRKIWNEKDYGLLTSLFEQMISD